MTTHWSRELGVQDDVVEVFKHLFMSFGYDSRHVYKRDQRRMVRQVLADRKADVITAESINPSQNVLVKP